ncbi:MAG: HEAT repeat domain-containing protein [Planctomycetota bacterium]
MVNGLGRHLFVLPAALLLVAGSLGAQDARQAFQEGKRFLYMNEPEKALEKFREAMNADPSHGQAYALWRETDAKIWEYMMRQGGDFEKIARRLQLLASVERKRRVSDPETIRGLIERALSEDRQDRNDALIDLMSNHGEYAVPFFVDALGNVDEEDKQIYAISAIDQIGRVSTLPLLPLLGSENKQLRQNAALCLRFIKDDRALPWLKRLAESDPDAGVREVATKGVMVIGGSVVPASKALFLEHSRRYLTGDPRLLRGDDVSEVLWSLNDGKLESRPVPAELFGLELAKEAAYGALEVDPSSQAAVVALARAYVAEKAVVDSVLTQDSEAEGISAIKDSIDNMAITVLAAGSEALRQVVNEHLDENMVPAAVAALRTLGDLEDPANLGGSPLLDGLSSGDKRVSYTCALILSGMDARLSDAQRNQVVANLGRAVLEQAVRVVQVVDPDTDNVRIAKQASSPEMWVTVDTTVADAVAKLRRFRNADVVVVNVRQEDLLARDLIDAVKRTQGLENTKIILVADNPDPAAETFGETVDGVLQGPITAVALQNKVDEVLQDVELDSNRAQAEAIAVSAAEALARLDPASFNVAEASASLARAAARKGKVAVFALEALGRAGKFEVIGEVQKALADNLDNAEISIAAARALGRMMARAGEAPKEVIDALMAIATNQDNAAGIRAAAVSALGRAPLAASKRAEVLRVLRVDPRQ